MSRGLGKIEKAVLRVCVRCLFAKDEILNGKKGYMYPGGVRFIHPENGNHFRGVSLGKYQRRMTLEDEELIDLKEVHYLYSEKFGGFQGGMFGSGMPFPSPRDFSNLSEKTQANIKEMAKTREEVSAMLGIRDRKLLSPSQEAAYQRAVKSVLRKEYLNCADFGYALNRFVRINRNKIKPIKPKCYKGNYNV